MPWYGWALIAYIVFDRLGTVAWIERSIDITRAFAALSIITGALIIWAICGLAGVV